MNRRTRVLLVEHLDATGAAPADARARVLALRQAGCTVETIVLDARAGDDLLYRTPETHGGPATETIVPNAAGLRTLASRARAQQPSLVLWAGAVPGGGAAAQALPRGPEAFWWPSGHAPAGAPAGPLPPLPGFAPPCGACAGESSRGSRQRLSLWDGPFVLVPAPLADATARDLLEGFAAAAAGRDEMDLVVLDHPHRGLEALARGCGADVRTHFVGPAPRDAEAAWLATASVVLVPGDAPLSGGLLLRALAAGAPPVAVGRAAEPIAAWLESAGCAWARPRDAAGITGAIERALDRDPAVQAVRERARLVAAAHAPAALAARLREALGPAVPGAAAA